jgi:hypothetical protein
MQTLIGLYFLLYSIGCIIGIAEKKQPAAKAAVYPMDPLMAAQIKEYLARPTPKRNYV